MAKVDDNVFPKIIESMNTTDPAAPTDASWKIYAKAGGIYARSSNAIVGAFGAAGGATGQLDFAAFTSSVTLNQTAEASAVTIVTGNSITYAATPIVISLTGVYVETSNTLGDEVLIWLFDNGSSIGLAGRWQTPAAATMRCACNISVELTPSAGAHTYSWRGTVTNAGRIGFVAAGAGGAAANQRGILRVVLA
jgi:hypothetical protein